MTGFYKEYDDTSGAYVSSAEDAAAAALVSKNAAAASATAAAASELSAGDQATAASLSETNAGTSATNAATSATNAATSETNAAGSATAAAGSATSASTDAGTATTKASEASTSATNAATSETNAASSATNAATSETNAATSATNAASSATTASTQATNAASSATAAATSETNASNSATAAATSETNAASSATSASGSATTATTKAGEAATSATNAATSETNAATSATNSANSATSAGTAQTAAEAARDAALAAFDSFDDRYLGPKASDPTTDNDGDALAAGMLYFNTTTDDMKVYEGSSWVAAYASLSGALLATYNLSDLNNVATARTNLGLGTAATTASTDYATSAQGTTADNALPKSGGAMTGAITTNSTFDGRDIATDGTKLDGIEVGATADQTAAEIKTAYESNADTNAFTDADHTKLDGIEAGADVTDTANVTAAGAVMDSELTSEASVKALNQGVATTDSPTFAAINVNGLMTSDDFQIDLGTTTASAEITTPSSISGFQAFRVRNTHTDGTLAFGTTLGQARIQAYGAMGAADPINIDVGNITAIGIDATGQVGIGTSSPASALDVNGDITANYVKADRIYSNNDGSSGYFYNDASTRTAYAGGDFYIQNSVGYYYNYATNIYLGATSGDTIYTRGNAVSGDNYLFATNGDFYVNARYGSNQLAYGVRAWGRFEMIGTHSFLDNEGFSSVTDIATGRSRLNFTNAMPNTYYSVNVTTGSTSYTSGVCSASVYSLSSTQFYVSVEDLDGGFIDRDQMNVMVVR